jgi:hypothetical protein
VRQIGVFSADCFLRGVSRLPGALNSLGWGTETCHCEDPALDAGDEAIP